VALVYRGCLEVGILGGSGDIIVGVIGEGMSGAFDVALQELQKLAIEYGHQ